jgi:AraC-like DNA-binding protein
LAGKNQQTAMQRAASLVPLRSLLEELDVGMGAVLEGTGVSPGEIGPDAFIPYTAFLAILDKSARLTGRDDLGMLLGKRQTLEALGPLGEVMRHAATLGEAIAAFAAFQSSNSTGGAVYLLRVDRDVILGYGVYDRTEHISPKIYDMVLAVGCNLIAELTRGAVGPEEMFHSRARPADPTPYLRLGRCPIRFGELQTGLLLRAPALAFPLPTADRDLQERALTRLQSAWDGAPMPLSLQVRHLLRPLLLMGNAGMNDVARRLGFHPRAMRRRLHKEGTTFESIKDEVRFAAARDLLMLGDLSIADIGATLDYGFPSSFVHAFRRWSGMSPARYRTQESITPAGDDPVICLPATAS